MKKVVSFGVTQCVLPSQTKVTNPILESLGYSKKLGSLPHRLALIKQQDPLLHSQLLSSSSMWTANIGWFSPSCDTKDKKMHVTPANLVTMPHRYFEVSGNIKNLNKLFSKCSDISIHDPVPGIYSDEGAANQIRLSHPDLSRGVYLFVFGKKEGVNQFSKKYPARQDFKACEIIMKTHGLDEKSCIFAQQSPAVIDQGVFHNDVIAMGCLDMLIVHEKAYINQKKVLSQCRKVYTQKTGLNLHVIEVSQKELSVKESVNTYFFNSQLIPMPDGNLGLLCPAQCKGHPKIKKILDRLITSTRLTKIDYVNVGQSMQNGGGPACLRFSLVMTKKQRQKLHHLQVS